MNNENQQIPMNERFAFENILVFGYFVSAYLCTYETFIQYYLFNTIDDEFRIINRRIIT